MNVFVGAGGAQRVLWWGSRSAWTECTMRNALLWECALSTVAPVYTAPRRPPRNSRPTCGCAHQLTLY